MLLPDTTEYKELPKHVLDAFNNALDNGFTVVPSLSAITIKGSFEPAIDSHLRLCGFEAYVTGIRRSYKSGEWAEVSEMTYSIG
jgi:hypothetical protein